MNPEEAWLYHLSSVIVRAQAASAEQDLLRRGMLTRLLLRDVAAAAEASEDCCSRFGLESQDGRPQLAARVWTPA